MNEIVNSRKVRKGKWEWERKRGSGGGRQRGSGCDSQSDDFSRVINEFLKKENASCIKTGWKRDGIDKWGAAASFPSIFSFHLFHHLSSAGSLHSRPLPLYFSKFTSPPRPFQIHLAFSKFTWRFPNSLCLRLFLDLTLLVFTLTDFTSLLRHF